MDRVEKRLAVRFGLVPQKHPAPGSGNQKHPAPGSGKQSVCQGFPKRIKVDDAAGIAASSGGSDFCVCPASSCGPEGPSWKSG